MYKKGDKLFQFDKLFRVFKNIRTLNVICVISHSIPLKMCEQGVKFMLYHYFLEFLDQF